MYFDLTEEQKAIVETVRSLHEDFLPENMIVAMAERQTLDRSLWGQFAALGFAGILVPEDQGGLGMDLVTLTAVQEQLGWAAAPVPVAESALAAWLLATHGSEAQKTRWLAPLIAGEAIAAFALDERQGSGISSWTVEGPALRGCKPMVAWGGEADLLIVGGRGGLLALVHGAAEGLTRSPVVATDGTRPLATIAFDATPAEQIGDGSEPAESLLDGLYIIAAADACGAGNRALALAVEYAKTRQQFGRLIGSFQGLKHQLANMAAEMEPARYLVWYAAHAWDTIPEKRSYAASVAKGHLGEVAVRTARGCVEAHGGIGYTWEYPLHIFLKRAMHDRTANGTPAFHRARSAALAGW